MDITVEEVLNLPCAVDWKVLAGEGGLRKQVRWYLCMISQLVGPWVHGREILFLYENSNIEMNEQSLLHLLSQSVENEISAIVFIMKKSHILPDAVINMANESNIPLIHMPNEIPMVDVSKEIAELIINRRKNKAQQGDIFKNVVKGHVSDKPKYISLLNSFIGNSKGYYVIVISYDHTKIKYLGFDIHNISTELQDAFGDVIYFIDKDQIVLLLSSNKEDFGSVEERCERITNITKGMSGFIIKGIGIGQYIEELSQIDLGYQTAIEVMHFAIRNNKCIGSYGKIGTLQRLMFTIENESILYTCFHGTIDMVAKYDNEHETELLMTLRKYLDEGGNIKRSSDNLFIHKNTMNYRLNKIKELLNDDLSNIVELKIKLECYDKYIVLKEQYNAK